ncbi:MAG: phosphatidate cytidylyltransferase [Acidobacteria bacterium]|nr:phosphatidate cytidylyltransferase [Acidobacteriota bacterium]MSO61509.1 phosphatidate cytidylyltransferase [Acidobacteriota bacterium]
MAASGCEAIGAIFKAGMVTGIIAVVLIVLVIGFLFNKMRR